MRKIVIIGSGLVALVLLIVIFIATTLYSNISTTISDIVDSVKSTAGITKLITNTQEVANTQLANFIGNSDAQSCVSFNQKLDALSKTGADKASFLSGFINDQVSSIKATVEKAPESAKVMACQKAADALDILMK